jgi:hypothetical protein
MTRRRRPAASGSLGPPHHQHHQQHHHRRTRCSQAALRSSLAQLHPATRQTRSQCLPWLVCSSLLDVLRPRPGEITPRPSCAQSGGAFTLATCQLRGCEIWFICTRTLRPIFYRKGRATDTARRVCARSGFFLSLLSTGQGQLTLTKTRRADSSSAHHSSAPTLPALLRWSVSPSVQPCLIARHPVDLGHCTTSSRLAGWPSPARSLPTLEPVASFIEPVVVQAFRHGPGATVLAEQLGAGSGVTR